MGREKDRDPEKYKEIEQQITSLANSAGAEDEDVKKLQNLVNNMIFEKINIFLSVLQILS